MQQLGPPETNGYVEKAVVEPAATKTKSKFSSVCKPRSSYIFFYTENQDLCKKENSNMTFSQIMKHLGQIWRNLPEDQRAPYKERAEKDMIRYKREIEAEREINGG